MHPIQIDDTSIALLKKVLDLRSDNQQVISANVANAETPGYRAAVFSFTEELRAALDRGDRLELAATRPGHLTLAPRTVAEVQGRIERVTDKTGIGDENSVKVEQEMLRLAENQLLFEAAVQMMKKKLGLLRYVASDGK